MDTLLELPNFDSEDINGAVTRFVNSPHYFAHTNPHAPRDPHLSDDRVVLFSVIEAVKKSEILQELLDFLYNETPEGEESEEQFQNLVIALGLICGMIIFKKKESK